MFKTGGIIMKNLIAILVIIGLIGCVPLKTPEDAARHFVDQVNAGESLTLITPPSFFEELRLECVGREKCKNDYFGVCKDKVYRTQGSHPDCTTAQAVKDWRAIESGLQKLRPCLLYSAKYRNDAKTKGIATVSCGGIEDKRLLLATDNGKTWRLSGYFETILKLRQKIALNMMTKALNKQ
jgi:hypothetical protein